MIRFQSLQGQAQRPLAHASLALLLLAMMTLSFHAALTGCGDDDDDATTANDDAATSTDDDDDASGTDDDDDATSTDDDDDASGTDDDDDATSTDDDDDASGTDDDDDTGGVEPLTFGNEPERGTTRHDGFTDFLYNTWGLERLDSLPPADFLIALAETEPEVFGNQFARYGFIPDPTDDLPVGLKRGTYEPEKVAQTCALCHAQQLPDGTVWLGLPATTLDFNSFAADVDERWVAAGNPSLRDNNARAKDYGPGRIGAEQDGSDFIIPVDFPPYLQLGERSNLNYLGTGQDVRSEVYLSLFGAGAGYPDDRKAKTPFPDEDKLAPFVEFFGGMLAPPPPQGDADLIARGAEVFEEQSCNLCHHVDNPSLDGVTTVDLDANGKERLPGEDPAFPTGSIRTSPAHMGLQDGDGFDPSFAPYVSFIVEKKLKVKQTDGYRVAILRGLAYTAPYLHNGSVPTLEDLLKPASERPKLFKRGDFTVDTTKSGNDNGGHEWGASLEDADRAALVEYLKSL